MLEAEPLSAPDGALRRTRGRGLLAQDVFERYCSGVGSNSGARLGSAELGRLLRDFHINLDYQGRCHALELASGRGAQSADFPAFLRLVAAAAGGPHMQRPGLAQDEAASAVLQAVFHSYDTNHSGRLEREECMRLLTDCGKAPQTVEQSQEICRKLALCRNDGLPGALDFGEFQHLLQKVLDQHS